MNSAWPWCLVGAHSARFIVHGLIEDDRREHPREKKGGERQKRTNERTYERTSESISERATKRSRRKRERTKGSVRERVRKRERARECERARELPRRRWKGKRRGRSERERERVYERGRVAVWNEGALVDHEATTNGAHIASCEHGPEGAREATAQSLVLLGGTRGVRRRTHVHGAWRGARSSKQLVCDSCGESASRIIVIFLSGNRDTSAQDKSAPCADGCSPRVSRSHGHVHGVSRTV